MPVACLLAIYDDPGTRKVCHGLCKCSVLHGFQRYVSCKLLQQQHRVQVSCSHCPEPVLCAPEATVNSQYTLADDKVMGTAEAQHMLSTSVWPVCGGLRRGSFLHRLQRCVPKQHLLDQHHRVQVSCSARDVRVRYGCPFSACLFCSSIPEHKSRLHKYSAHSCATQYCCCFKAACQKPLPIKCFVVVPRVTMCYPSPGLPQTAKRQLSARVPALSARLRYF